MSTSDKTGTMKVILLISACCALAAVIQGKYCGGAMQNDPSTCSHTCPQGESKACEHGGICTCATMCMSKEDCKSANVTCASHSDPANQGHMMQEEVHCFDAACVCMPAPNQGGGMHPGGNHGGYPGGHNGGSQPGRR